MAPEAAAIPSQPESEQPLGHMGAAVQGSACLNCGLPLMDRFCSHCGQRAGDARVSVHEMLREIASEHFGLDTKVARTLAALFRHPGRLTVEFLAGRRVRYLPPLRLYVYLSVAYFLASAFGARFSSSANADLRAVDITSTGSDTAATATTLKAIADSTGITPRTIQPGKTDTLHGSALVLYFKRRAVRRLVDLRAHKAQVVPRLREAFQHELPDALFLLVPGLALALLALYRGSHRYYSEHLVFALHFQAFGFAAQTVALLPISALHVIISCALVVYLFLALRLVYGGSVAVTAGKTAVIVVGYGISLVVIMAVVGIIAFLFG
jgi:uncharacterized protein DUF3667